MPNASHLPIVCHFVGVLVCVYLLVCMSLISH